MEISYALEVTTGEEKPMASQFEKRQHHPRLPIYMAASIVMRGRTLTCIVREISPAGAKLELDDDWILGRGFWLRLEGDPQMHYCSVAWANRRLVGVEFRSDHRGSWWQHGRNLLQPPHRARL